MTAGPTPTAPSVSVISIFYNAADYLVEAIESVLAQDCDDFELLLVDDGSFDGSSAIAERFAHLHSDRIRHLRHPARANRGASASRNLGIRSARGEFIAFIDADDRWRPAKLREQLHIFERFPEVDAVCGTVNYWKSWAGGRDQLIPTGHVQNRVVRPPEAALSLYPLGWAVAPCPSDLMVRRATAMSIGGFEEPFTGPLQAYEDQAFLAKLYLTGSIYFADRVWLDYRRHDRSCMAAMTREGYYDGVRQHFLEWFEKYLADRPERPPLAVTVALRRALYRNQHPYLTLPLRFIGRFLRKFRMA